jgi:hypothetical protein
MSIIGKNNRFGTSDQDSTTGGHFSSIKHDLLFGMYFFPYLTIPALIDLPFSLAFDIICFPFEVAMDVRRDHIRNRDNQFWETYFANGGSLSMLDDERKYLSNFGRSTIINHIRKPLPKHQNVDMIRIGFASDVAQHQTLDRELFELCINDRQAIPHLIGNPSVTPQMLHEIIVSSKIKLTEEILIALAQSNKTSQADLESLYSSRISKSVILTLLENPNTPDALLCRIFTDSEEHGIKWHVSQNMASRASVPPEIQNFILLLKGDEKTQAHLIQNKAILPEIRSALIQPKLISEFCRQKLLSPDQVRQLLDEAPADLRAIMENDKEIMSYTGKAKK